jgi:hypothetical protein
MNGKKIQELLDRRLDNILDRLYSSSYLDECRRLKKPFSYLQALAFFGLGMILFGMFSFCFYLEGRQLKKNHIHNP